MFAITHVVLQKWLGRDLTILLSRSWHITKCYTWTWTSIYI